MRFFLSFYVAFFLGFCATAQKESYLDSISVSISQLPTKEQIEQIVAIPYDKAVGDINTFDILVEKALVFSKELKDTLLLAKSLEKKRLVLHFSSRVEETIAISLEIIGLYEQLNMPKKVGDSYANLAWKIKYLDLEKAMSYMQKSIKLLEANYDPEIINPVYDNYGAMHSLNKQWDSALHYHKKSLKIKKDLNDSIGIPFGFCHLAEVYTSTKRYNLAKRYLDSAMSIRKQRKDTYGVADTYLYIGDLYYYQGDYKKGIENYLKGYNLAKEYKYFPMQRYAAEYLYKSYNDKGNYKKALDYHLLYTTLNDSILNVETNNRIHKLEIQFETEKKEKEILTQRADIAEKELSLNKKNTQILGLGVLAVVLSLLGYLFYNQQRLKNRQLQKENELKDALVKIETQNRLQEQRLRISRDLHDNIGSQLTFIISSLDNLKYGFKLPDKLTDKLKTISGFTSSTIQELRDTIWAMNKNDISLEDLEVRISNFIAKAEETSEKIDFSLNTSNAIDKDLHFSSVQGMNIYRILQEAVNNALKYAEPSNIKLSISKVEDQTQFSVVDDGKGFNIAETELGNGLNNMRKRAQEIGGDFVIDSRKDKGTTILLRI